MESRQECVEALSRLYSSTHILTQDMHLLEWQHRDSTGNLNFACARDPDDRVVAILGYVPTTHWSSDVAKLAYFGTTWAADRLFPGAGVALLRWFISSIDPHPYFTVGFSSEAKVLMEKLGLSSAELGHYFWAAPDFWAKKMSLRSPSGPPAFGDGDQSPDVAISLIHESDVAISWRDDWVDALPTRSPGWVIGRYFGHPRFTYKVWLSESGSRRLIVVTREADSPLGKIVRVLERLGLPADTEELFPASLSKILELSGAGIADFYSFNSPSLGRREPLPRVSDFHGLIVPNYLDPAEMKNVCLMIASTDLNLEVTRGDGDQDRPSS